MPDSTTRRPLGQTGLLVTPICIGTAPLGSMANAFGYEVPEDRALETLRAVFASPINFIDTSNNYGWGESERRIGIVLRELGGVPPGVVLATKADRGYDDGDFSGDRMRRSVAESQERLRVERFQLVHLHDPEHAPFEVITARGGALDALVELRAQGVIEHLGLAGGPVAVLDRYLSTGVFEVLITHNRYTVIERSATALLERARSMGLGVLNAAPYGSGILAKGVAGHPRYGYRPPDPAFVERIEAFHAACERHGVPAAAAALQFSMRSPAIDATIVGITRPERVTQTLELAAVSIPDALWAELEPLGFAQDDPRLDRW
jgi:D-threo-aldose 1-dehydrogenase